MPDFLLELRSEEIPARMQAKAEADLARLFAEQLGAAGLYSQGIQTYATPRRLALIARGLLEQTPAVREETKGPRSSAPPQALEGFLRKTGLTRDQLEERDGIYFAVVEKPGRATADVLAAAIPAIIRGFPWPKSMRWGDASVETTSLRWVRPLQGIVALLGEDIVPVEIAGVTSGAATVGHRFHHPGIITIGSANDYVEKLQACHVIVDPAERRRIIAEGAAAAASAAGLTLVVDEGLLDENAGLTEWPVPLLGSFDPAFLQVPPEVIQLTMRTNQKYFAVTGAGEALAPNFICTANIEAADGGEAIVRGNQKVLAARLSDAKFFWEQDLKVPLESQAEKLGQIVFHEKLGPVADKVERVAKLARWLVEEGIVRSSPGRGGGPAQPVEGGPSPAERTENPLHHQPSADGLPPRPGEDHDLAALAERAARLAKADLVTSMVGEFPELQGIIGGHLARAQGENPAIADAIRDHYKPVGQGDEVPTAAVTLAVGLADKLDTLVSFFAIGQKPSGSRDPFALRRAALGIIRVCLQNELRISLADAIREARWRLVESLGKAKMLVHFPDDAKWTETYPALPPEMLYRAGGDIAVLDWNDDFETSLIVDGTACSAFSRDFLSETQPQHLTLASLADVVGSCVLYFTDRIEEAERKSGVRADLIRAVVPKEYLVVDLMSALLADKEPRARGPGVERFRRRNWRSPDDPVEILARVRALQAVVETREGADLLAGYKRAANILKKEGYSPSPQRGEGRGEGERAFSERPVSEQMPPTQNPLTQPSPPMGEGFSLSYTPEPEEAQLIAALDSAEPRARAAVEAEDFEGAMAALASLRGPVDAFFDKVTVNDPDPAKRSARLDLLARMRDAVHAVADFSRIEG
ncbi:MAG TPA: glycine--tRNA ligase subunit beta [Allosphingosinicella sp.]|jgi:glycyl-tRNA synthetase beta chain|uniref:glycine--tRNA ligase subunit beta n=1 Tax=Allosphingosinicella sp. TaxID=2823234 RepID=UPI002F27D589